MSEELLNAASDAFTAIGNPKYNALRIRLSLEIADMSNHRLSADQVSDERGGDNAELGRDSHADIKQRSYD